MISHFVTTVKFGQYLYLVKPRFSTSTTQVAFGAADPTDSTDPAGAADRDAAAGLHIGRSLAFLRQG